MRYPAYYLKFACIADRCLHSCCRGWEIDIDPESLSFYRNHQGNLTKRFASAIAEAEDGGHFILTSDESCPFLNSNGLCDIYTILGKNALCEICTEHPRYYSSFGDTDYVGIGLCCEAAAELILSSDSDLTLLGEEQSPLSEFEATLYPIWISLLNQIDTLSKHFLDSGFFGVEMLHSLLDFLLSLDANNLIWTELLHTLKGRIKEILKSRESFLSYFPEVRSQYTNLTHYFLYRHVPKALQYEILSDGISAKLRFSLVSVGIIHLLDLLQWVKIGSFTMKDAVNIARLYSEEIEYSEENTEALENFVAGLRLD